MKLDWHIPHDHRHDAAVAAFRTRSGPRTGRFEVEGEVFWIKAVDTPGLINRVQKGPADRAYAADLAAQHNLAARGVPVPEIVAEGASLFVTRDSGPTLERMLRDQTGTLDQRIAAFSDAGTALARLHGLGISHGRPVLRDICWKDGRTTFLDFENYRPHRNQPSHFRLDLVIFVFSCYAQQRSELPEIVAAKDAYRANDPCGVWPAAERWVRKMGWVDLLTKPLQWRPDPHAREFKAIAPTLRAFGA
jgi:hypothetical protein